MMRLLLMAAAVCLVGAAVAEPAEWDTSVKLDDFDDSKTFVAVISATKQGSIVVRYHESTPANYEIYWAFPSDIWTTCGDTGDWMEHSGWGNLQVRVDGGKVMSLRGTPSTDKKAAFLRDGSADTVNALVMSLKTAKKLVIRTKDDCHEKGQAWIFSKFDDIAGEHNLDGIEF